ncbi:hypothetical protein GL263_15360 [Streptomyces durbertensis]|uniref:Uncharacterized protein n=1 Tax=Streptomyces durbertensis TaxID=2448886 RepID=A0ABR6EIE1_9ACTN|nr:hypothetical protein [Streptomyces durbertensis]MBB1244933.1 hypothetical protein [Streptomyces durbertensis]
MSGRRTGSAERIRMPGAGMVIALASVGLVGPAVVLVAETARGATTVELPALEPSALSDGSHEPAERQPSELEAHLAGSVAAARPVAGQP